MSERLGTAQWESPQLVPQRYPFAPGSFFIGRAEDDSAIGYNDDRHICVVSGTRGGKGTSLVINNLCLWPGSVVVVDPKGENATVTAARRGQGGTYRDDTGQDAHVQGMGQDVHVLDPYSAAEVDACYRSSFNPLAGLDANDSRTIREVSRIAASLVIVDDSSENKGWDEKARTLIRGIILHVLSADRFDERSRNLLTVAELVQCGDQLLAEWTRDTFPDKKPDSPLLLLFKAMQQNPAFDGRVARIGAEFRAMYEDAPKQFLGVTHSANTSLAFTDTPEMARCLLGKGRSFRLSELKINPRGVSLYLSLPLTELRDKDYRWLRMMIDLLTTQMELTRVKPPRRKAAPTATGYPLLAILDEFKSLRRMSLIEDAAAQLAGFGMKLCFIVQNLTQMKETYKDGWESFFSCAGLKIASSIDDNFSRNYLSEHIGETEIIREVRNVSESRAQNESQAVGTSHNRTASQSTTHSTSKSVSHSHSTGTTFSETTGDNQSKNSGANASNTIGSNESFGLNQSHGTNSSNARSGPKMLFSKRHYYNNGSTSHGVSDSTGLSVSTGSSMSHSAGTSQGVSTGQSRSFTDGGSESYTAGLTYGTSDSQNYGTSESTGTSETRTTGETQTRGHGSAETIQRRRLVTPDEIGRNFGRIDDMSDPRYPGLALVIVSGANPFVVRRANYFQDALCIDSFGPHPDHEFVAAVTVTAIRGSTLRAEIQAADIELPALPKWLLTLGEFATPGQAAAQLESVLASIRVPCVGKVIAGPWLYDSANDPDGDLISVRNYPWVQQDFGIDPFAEIRALPRRKPLKAPAPELLEAMNTAPAPVTVLSALPVPASKESDGSDDWTFTDSLKFLGGLLFSWLMAILVGKLASDSSYPYSFFALAGIKAVAFCVVLTLSVWALFWGQPTKMKP